MTYIQHYDSPLGGILLAANEIGLTGLWFDGAKYFADGLPAEQADKALEILHANGEPEAYRLGVIAEGEGVELC